MDVCRVLKNLSFTRLVSFNAQSFRFLSTSLHSPDLQAPFDAAAAAADADRILKLISANSSSSNIEASLSRASIAVSPPLVAEVVKRLSNAGALALSFFKWAEKQKGFRHSTESYNALIEALGKIKQFNVAWTLVHDMKRRGLLTKETFAVMCRRYARARKVKEAVEAFEKMEKFGLTPDSSDFNRLIDTLCKGKNVGNAHQVFDKMKKRFSLDIKSYTILLEGWGQERNHQQLMEVWREMKDEGFEPDVVAYGIMINAYCKSKRYDDAVKLFDEMLQKNCNPSPHIFCTLINGLGSDKRLKDAIDYFNQCKSSGLVIETPTYNALVGAYCWSGKINEAYKVVDEMREIKVGPNSRTYDIILHHLIRSHKNKEAYSVFQKMSSETEPTLSTYEIMVRMFCNENRVDMAVRTWDQMKGKGIMPGMHMFSALITELCHENKLDDACKYFEEMLDMGIRPPANLFSKLKKTLVDEGRNEMVLSLTKKIDQLRKTPLVNSPGHRVFK